MTTTKTDRSMLQMRRTLKAPVETVYKAWTEPTQIARWWGCADSSDLQVAQDLRIGGEYSYQVTTADGEIVTASGVYQEIIANKKLVYTWNNSSSKYPAKDTTVTVEFISHGDSTELVVTHSNFAKPLSVEGHTMGWGAALDKFAALFE